MIKDADGIRTEIPAPANADELRGPDLTHSIDPTRFEALVPKLANANKELKLFYFSIGGMTRRPVPIAT
jgi:hypothetical protein